MSAFTNAGFNGSQRVKRLVLECLPADNTSRVVNVDQFTIEKPDTTAPVATVNTSTGGSSFPKNGSITATATATDASGIHFVEFLINGVRYDADTSSPYSTTFTLPAAGTYRLTSIAYDMHGNPGRSTVKNLTIY